MELVVTSHSERTEQTALTVDALEDQRFHIRTGQTWEAYIESVTRLSKAEAQARFDDLKADYQRMPVRDNETLIEWQMQKMGTILAYQFEGRKFINNICTECGVRPLRQSETMCVKCEEEKMLLRSLRSWYSDSGYFLTVGPVIGTVCLALRCKIGDRHSEKKLTVLVVEANGAEPLIKLAAFWTNVTDKLDDHHQLIPGSIMKAYDDGLLPISVEKAEADLRERAQMLFAGFEKPTPRDKMKRRLSSLGFDLRKHFKAESETWEETAENL